MPESGRQISPARVDTAERQQFVIVKARDVDEVDHGASLARINI
jgi:hypothetical protein